MTTPARARYTGHRFPAEIIGHAVWLYFRFPLGLRMVDELPNGAWRETSTFEEQVIETFAHDRGTLGYRSRCDRWSARRQTVLHAPAAAE